MAGGIVQNVSSTRMLGGAPVLAPADAEKPNDGPASPVSSKAAIADDFNLILAPTAGVQKVSQSVQNFYRRAVFGQEWGGAAFFGTLASGVAAMAASGTVGLYGLAATAVGSAAMFVAGKVNTKRQLEAPVKLQSEPLALTDQSAEKPVTASDVATAKAAQAVLAKISDKKINDPQTIARLTALVERGDAASPEEKARADRWTTLIDATTTTWGDAVEKLFVALPHDEQEALAPILRERLFSGSNTRHPHALYELLSSRMPPDFPEVSIGPDHGVIAPRTSIDALELLDAMAKFYQIDRGQMEPGSPPLRDTLLAPERTDFERALVGQFAQRLKLLGAAPHHAPSQAFLQHLTALGDAQPQHASDAARALLKNVDRFTRSAYVAGHASRERSYSSRDDRRTLDELIGAMRLGVASEL